MKRDNADIFKNKQHYENISQRIRHTNDKLLGSKEKLENKTKKKKKKDNSDIEKMLLEKTFETESLSKEYLKIMYKENTGHLPNENQYNNLLQDLKSKGYVFSENGKPHEPKYNSKESEKENFERFRNEWGNIKQNIDTYFNKYY